MLNNETYLHLFIRCFMEKLNVNVVKYDKFYLDTCIQSAREPFTNKRVGFCFYVFSSAIFQEDCKIVSGSRSPPQIVIKLRFSSYLRVCIQV